MENEKPTYEQIEQELNEYKDWLWQLSDEYKLNLGKAEKELEEERSRILTLQNQYQQVQANPTTNFLSLLGLPACIIDNEGLIISHNNKFKFLVELIGYEIESVSNISSVFEKNTEKEIIERFAKYLQSEEGILHGLYRTQNQFQGTINMIIRVYRHENESQHLALFVELNSTEIQKLTSNQKANINSIPETSKKEDVPNSDTALLEKEISIFAEKYELFDEISKSPEFQADKNEISSALLQSVKRTFDLDQGRNKILDKLQNVHKAFIFHINQKYPELTNNEEKHCLLIKAGLTYKEIAAIMDVSINGVKIARNRLRKKLDLENETKTSDFIENIF